MSRYDFLFLFLFFMFVFGPVGVVSGIFVYCFLI